MKDSEIVVVILNLILSRAVLFQSIHIRLDRLGLLLLNFKEYP